MYSTLILAAGYGSRLRPLTDVMPKPLVPYFGCPILYSAIFRTRRMNPNGPIFINGHHLAEKIATFLSQNEFNEDQNIQFLVEETLLGTGGPIATVHQHINDQPLLIYNSDCLQKIDTDELYHFHTSGGYHATMVLLPFCPQGKNPVYLKDNRILAIGQNDVLAKDPDATAHTLAGVHMVGSDFQARIPAGEFFDVRETYSQLMQSEAGIGGYVYNGPWFDVGEPADYWQAHETILVSDKGSVFLEEIGVFSYLNKKGLSVSSQFGPNVPCFFDLGQTTNKEYGHLHINLDPIENRVYKTERVLVLEEGMPEQAESGRIYAPNTTFQL